MPRLGNHRRNVSFPIEAKLVRDLSSVGKESDIERHVRKLHPSDGY